MPQTALPAGLPQAASITVNPDAETLRSMTADMPSARETRYGNLNVTTKVLARSKRSTFLVSDMEIEGHQVMSRADYETWAQRQDAYISEQAMVVIDGYIGDDPEYRVPARLYIEQAHANIAAMQNQLFFPAESEIEPELTVIYTPRLAADGWPDDRLIATDLENGITRVFNSDYFGESKKGNLRQWNRLVYDRGGLPLHAGAKVIPTDHGNRVAMIVGLSGTGKTTTTFTKQNGSLPVQDDFVAWWPSGAISSTEAGCFAKTFGLSEKDEPTIYRAVTSPEAYLENVSQDESGDLDFFDTSYTQNGRATFSFQAIEHAAASELKSADILLILNRNENIIPAVARLTAEQAAAYFMLGETTGTSAGGADEADKFLRVPGTNPFFPMPHGMQGNRFLELQEQNPLEVYVMSTGSVGGKAGSEGAMKVKIAHSSAIVKAIAEGTIEWTRDPDFGYEVAASVPGIAAEDLPVLQPRLLYEQQGRIDEYNAIVERLKGERREFLHSFSGLDSRIVDAL